MALELNTHIKISKFLYQLLASNDRAYLYEQYDEEGKLIAYEVFKRVVEKERLVKFPNGIERYYPARVRFPNDRDFGLNAWSYGVYNNQQKAEEVAKNKYESITNNTREN